MAKFSSSISLLTFLISQFFIQGVISAATFTFTNKCGYMVWPGILSNAGIAPISPTGFVLQTGDSKVINAPSSWGGRFWGRTYCGEDSTGKFTCLTGDCGSGKLECSGAGAAPPATLAEFTLDGYGGMDFYDVSLVDGYNLPILVTPQGGTGNNCTFIGCVADLNSACPTELKVMSTAVGEGVACKSACEAFDEAQYCCSGAYGSPTTCKPSSYSELFKTACPRAYSYAYDDKTSTFTCTGANYLITFCPSPNSSQKSSSSEVGNSSSTNALNGTGTIVYEGANAMDTSSAPSPYRSPVVVAGAVAILAAVWQLCHLF